MKNNGLSMGLESPRKRTKPTINDLLKSDPEPKRRLRAYRSPSSMSQAEQSYSRTLEMPTSIDGTGCDLGKEVLDIQYILSTNVMSKLRNRIMRFTSTVREQTERPSHSLGPAARLDGSLNIQSCRGLSSVTDWEIILCYCCALIGGNLTVVPDSNSVANTSEYWEPLISRLRQRGADEREVMESNCVTSSATRGQNPFSLPLVYNIASDQADFGQCYDHTGLQPAKGLLVERDESIVEDIGKREGSFFKDILRPHGVQGGKGTLLSLLRSRYTKRRTSSRSSIKRKPLSARSEFNRSFHITAPFRPPFITSFLGSLHREGRSPGSSLALRFFHDLYVAKISTLQSDGVTTSLRAAATGNVSTTPEYLEVGELLETSVPETVRCCAVRSLPASGRDGGAALKRAPKRKRVKKKKKKRRGNYEAAEHTVVSLRSTGGGGRKSRSVESGTIYAMVPSDFPAKFERGVDAWDILDLNWRTATRKDVERRYRQLARNYHPDRGGRVDNMVSLTQARELLGTDAAMQHYNEVSGLRERCGREATDYEDL